MPYSEHDFSLLYASSSGYAQVFQVFFIPWAKKKVL